MKDYEVIIRPHITEKTTAEAAMGKYSFIVDRKATKIDVKKAVENLFNVKVLSVNTISYDGKKKTRRQNSGVVVGYTAAYKKAIVKIDTDPKDVTYLEKGGKVVKSARKYKGSIEEFGVQ
ncbi:MAG: 50S ribosomal protein L23 [Clostridia bacterium]|nr:50S ribosomal protein L23 [Clostridia bacterium]